MIAKSEVIGLTVLVHHQKFYESFFVGRRSNSDAVIGFSCYRSKIIGTKIFYMTIVDKGNIAFYA
ncbi:hypothetical protein D3C84_1210140 [compost metagenome]